MRDIYKYILKSKKYISVEEFQKMQEKMGDLFNIYLFDKYKIYDTKEILFAKYASEIIFFNFFNQSIDGIK